MAKLIYVANVSLDGCIEEAHGRFEWTAPTDEVFTFITDLVRPVGTYLYGRRMYETMAVWEADPADPTLAAQSELRADFANVWTLPTIVGRRTAGMSPRVGSSCAPGVHLRVRSFNESELTCPSSRAFAVGDAGLDPTTSTV